MTGLNSLPGSESDAEALNSLPKVIPSGDACEAPSDALGDPSEPVSLLDFTPPDRIAPCELDQRETSGDGDAWPGSPCLIEAGLCLTCGARTLPPVWRDEQGHDEWCESYWDDAVKMDHPCGCGDRAGSGCYPDGRREPK